MKGGVPERSGLMLGNVVLVMLAIILQGLSLGTEYWVVRSMANEIRWHSGIWTYVFNRAIPPEGIIAALYPVLVLTGLALLLLCLIVNMMAFFRDFPGIIPLLITCSGIAGLLDVVAVIAWAIPHAREEYIYMSWSYAMNVGAAFFAIVASVLYIFELIYTRNQPDPHRRMTESSSTQRIV